ncbi:MAG TPA: SpoIIE family protein phosphatase [Petrotogaceae bacterium]|nr:SpoIIE family protein phosphatase [Petrotogaceae bacterium]
MLANSDMTYTVLIIDDSPINRMFIKTVVEDGLVGFKVIECENGRQGLSIAKEKSPDLILLDIMMPEMDGYTVCGLLKNDPSTKEIPVIFLSALSEIEDKTKGFEAGGVDYITKPADPREILARVFAHARLYRTQKSLLDYINRIDQELSIAQIVQFELLPKNLRVNDLKMEWLYQISNNVSGDIFGVIPYDQQNSIVYMVDVSGHGVASAMRSTMIKQKLESVVLSKGITDPEIIAKNIENELSGIFFDGAYFTMVIARITQTQVELCNFGHREPILINRNGMQILNGSDFPIGFGIIKDIPVAKTKFDFLRDDVLILYTDGLVETTNDENLSIPFEKILEIIGSVENKTPINIVNAISHELKSFLGDKQPEDDITLLVLKRE